MYRRWGEKIRMLQLRKDEKSINAEAKGLRKMRGRGWREGKRGGGGGEQEHERRSIKNTTVNRSEIFD